MSPLASDVLSPDLGQYVELFDIDLTGIGGDHYRITQSAYESSLIYFDGHAYTPFPVQADGFESKAGGSLPRPKIKVSNVTRTFLADIIGLDDIVGGIVTRRRTLRHYLDNQSQENPLELFPVDEYVISQKLEQNPLYVEWELCSVLDVEGSKLPGEQILRDYCSHTYRRWNGSAWINRATNPELISCPYVGAGCWDLNGDALADNSPLDRCGKKVSDCRLRFQGLPLPTRAFPAVGRNKA